MQNPLNLSCMGILVKHAAVTVKENVLVQTQIKCTDSAEILEIVNTLDKWGVESLKAAVPAYGIPWSKMVVPLNDYSLYFKMNFGADMYSGKGGEEFSVRLDSLTFTHKMKDDQDVLECVMTFLKNADDEINDMRFNTIFLKYKEADPETGKKALKLFPVKLDQIDSFVLGNMVEVEDSESTVVEMSN